MLQIPEDALERVFAALIGLDLGIGIEGTAMAALHLLGQHQETKEQRAREEAQASAIIEELKEGQGDVARGSSPGIPVSSPRDSLKEPPAGPIPAPYVARRAVEGVNVACQTEETIPGDGSTWDEMAGALESLRNQDEEARAQRLAEEQRLRETRDRLEAARAREVDLAEALGDDDAVAGASPTRRFCPACKRPGPKDASRCPNKAKHQRRRRAPGPRRGSGNTSG